MKYLLLFCMIALIYCLFIRKRLNVGNKAPMFILPDAGSNLHDLSEFLGKYVVIIFYPRNGTYLCNKELSSFQSLYSQFLINDIVLIGISSDTSASHAQIAHALKLQFLLLSDVNNKAARLYRALYCIPGITINKRMTFVIDKLGNISNIYKPTNIQSHPKEVLDHILKLIHDSQ